jgi:hypothetical protein
MNGGAHKLDPSATELAQVSMNRRGATKMQFRSTNLSEFTFASGNSKQPE